MFLLLQFDAEHMFLIFKGSKTNTCLINFLSRFCMGLYRLSINFKNSHIHMFLPGLLVSGQFSFGLPEELSSRYRYVYLSVCPYVATQLVLLTRSSQASFHPFPIQPHTSPPHQLSSMKGLILEQ